MKAKPSRATLPQPLGAVPLPDHRCAEPKGSTRVGVPRPSDATSDGNLLSGLCAQINDYCAAVGANPSKTAGKNGNEMCIRDSIQRSPDDMPQDGLLMSSAFVEAYVLHYRRPHLRLLRRLAKSTRLVVVPPPTIADYGNIPQVRALLIRLMRNEGLDVFDPVEKLLSLDAPFPEDLSAGDGNHANTAFGSMVIDALRKAGKL